jgi:hypothetical protein
MYDDYATSEFHWQSHNAYGPKKTVRLVVYKSCRLIKKIFLLEKKANDEKGNTMGYVFIGEGVLKRNRRLKTNEY